MTLSSDEILVVTGLPRSGTSMMMQILFAAGFPILSDEQRMPDHDNPSGYFEFDRVKRLQSDVSWLHMACGKAIKVVSPLLFFLPQNYRYKLLFMDRSLSEVISSQMAMLQRANKYEDYEGLARHYDALYRKHLETVHSFVSQRDNFSALLVSHSKMIHSPEGELSRVADFLGAEDCFFKNLSGVVKRDLYRCRDQLE